MLQPYISYTFKPLKIIIICTNKYRIPSARAKWWDSSDGGAYFITIRTTHSECYFGDSIDSVMVLSYMGKIVQKYWLEIPEYFFRM